MSSDLERRLEGMFAAAPQPDAGAGEEALHRALHALRPVTPPRRGLRTAALAFTVAVVLLVIAAGSLATAGALHVTFGAKTKPRPIQTQLELPKGANGIAAIVDGRLSVVTRGGFRLQGLSATAVALSPHALYIAAGIHNSLVAMAPDGRKAWSHPAGGKVVAIAWRPDGLEIAYVVRSGHRLALHLIYGNGKRDMLIDRSVRAIRPSWRADSLALAYVGAGGKAIVYDLGHRSRRVATVEPPVSGVAFAPKGPALAVATPGDVWLFHDRGASAVERGTTETFGWLNGRLAVTGPPGLTSAVIRTFSPTGAPRGSSDVQGVVLAVTPKLVVVRSGRKILAGRTTLLTTRPAATVRDLQIG
jgi:hypothetical protein